jgi:hypothetical protein
MADHIPEGNVKSSSVRPVWLSCKKPSAELARYGIGKIRVTVRGLAALTVGQYSPNVDHYD